MVTLNLNVELLLTLESKKDWINKVPYLLPRKIHQKEEFLWIDSLGNKMSIGEDFNAAEVLGTYPIYVYRHFRALYYLKNQHVEKQ